MNTEGSPSVLLIGPYDPHCGEYTFLAPPLGVWRLAGVLSSAGIDAKVFDPNCCRETPQRSLERELLAGDWDIVGVSTTGMTLRYDLELAHIVRRMAPHSIIVAGGMEATFRPDLMFELGPFDLVVLGEGEHPLLELVSRVRPHVVLCDIGLPEMDGIELCHRVRALGLRPRPMMVALTGWGQLEDRRRTLEAGFDLHLVKPVAPDALRRALSAAAAGSLS